MEPKGGNSKSSSKRSSRATCGRTQTSKQYERALPLFVPEIRPWGGVSKYKEPAYGDVSSFSHYLLKSGRRQSTSKPQFYTWSAVRQGAKLTRLRLAA